MTRTSDSVPLNGISRRTFCKGAAVLGIWGGLASFGLAGCAPHIFLRCFPALVRRMRHFSCRSYPFWTVIHLSKYCLVRNYQLQSS